MNIVKLFIELLVCLIPAPSLFGISPVFCLDNTTTKLKKNLLRQHLTFLSNRLRRTAVAQQSNETLLNCLEVQTTHTKLNYSQSRQTYPSKMSKHRLSSEVLPKAYDLYLNPELDTGEFTGKVSILVEVLKDVDAIVLNSKMLDVVKVSINNVEGVFETDDAFELLTIYADGKQIIQKGSKTVTIEYRASMKNKIVGLYLSTYNNSEGTRR